MSEWIDVNERLPEYNIDVLCYIENGFCEVMMFSFKRNDWSADFNPTHWMPLPTAPTPKTK